jgi:hypothetical protein
MKECFYLNKEFDIANEIQDSKNLNDLFEEYKTKY